MRLSRSRIDYLSPDSDPHAKQTGFATATPVVVRLKIPPDLNVPAHQHPTEEAVTVISGDFRFRMGGKLDESKAEKLGPGGSSSLGSFGQSRNSPDRRWGFTSSTAYKMAKLLAAHAGWNSQRFTMPVASLYRLTETASDELLKHSD